MLSCCPLGLAGGLETRLAGPCRVQVPSRFGSHCPQAARGASSPPSRHLQFCPLQAPSITLGFRAAADLLSPLALLRFSAVARGQDPLSGESKARPLPRVGLAACSCGLAPLTAFPAAPGLGHLRRLGLVYFLYLFLFSGLEYTLSFLAHQRFQFSRWEDGPLEGPFLGPPTSGLGPALAHPLGPSPGTWVVWWLLPGLPGLACWSRAGQLASRAGH